MDYQEFIAEAEQAGRMDSQGSIKTDIDSMRRKLAGRLHGEEALWLVSLLQSAGDIGCQRVSLQTQASRLEIAVTSGDFPTPATFAPYLTGTDTGCSSGEWCLLRALLSLPGHYDFSWHGPDGSLIREQERWRLESEQRSGNKPLHRFQVVNPQTRDHWAKTVRACSFRFPLPPFPLYLNKQVCWPELSGGGHDKLLVRRGTPGEDLSIRASDTEGKVGRLIRLGLNKKPYHRIVYLDRGARIHHQDLGLESYFVSTEIFVSGRGLPTDLGGFSLRETPQSKLRLGATKRSALKDLKKLLSQLISRPQLPLDFEEQQRKESVVSSALALGGLSFLQVPFFHPFVTLGLAGALIGGIGLNSMVKRRREPWRGEYGIRRIRRDLVEMRKQIEQGANAGN